jgi:hypothetical protein
MDYNTYLVREDIRRADGGPLQRQYRTSSVEAPTPEAALAIIAAMPGYREEQTAEVIGRVPNLWRGIKGFVSWAW